MRRLFIVFLLINVFLVSNCTEDEILSSNSSLSYLSSDGYEIIDLKKPELHTVNADGNSVTLQFTNHAYPDKPRGGYELMLNGNRTRESIIPRLFSDQKNLSLTFSLSNPEEYSYQIYARWHSGYLRSNKLNANESLNDSSDGNETPSSSPVNEEENVTPPTDFKEPVISGISINGNDVKIKFVNFSSPDEPEGGYELMVNGERTRGKYTPRLFSNEKNLSMTFSISNPTDKYYQIYARWNSGYLRSNKLYPESSEDNTEGTTEDNLGSTDSNDDPNLPNFKVLKEWNFDGSSPTSEGGLQLRSKSSNNTPIVNASGASNGKAIKIAVDNNRRANSRIELVTTSTMPSSMKNYFRSDKGFAYAKMDNEVIYQFKVKLTNNWQQDTRGFNGDGYTSLVEFKQDYYPKDDIIRKRDATFRIRVAANQYNIVFRATGESFENAPRDSHGNIDQSGSAKVKKISAERDFGKWITWTIRANWTSKRNGYIYVYKNDQLVYSRTNTFTAYDDEPSLGPYMKFGLYDPWFARNNFTGSGYKEILFDFMRIGVPN